MRRFETIQRHVVGDRHLSLPSSASDDDGLLYDIFSSSSSSFPSSVSVGKVVVAVSRPEAPELVPFGVAAQLQFDSENVLETLQWMLKKHLLGQDMFLLSSPGPLARWTAFKWCELLSRECRVVTVTPDTTESDLKQRREIRGRSLVFVDSPAVEAAKRGLVLVVEGLDLAERGVATVLNNLLENREMQLEDGTFLTARYDSLTPAERSKNNFVRVDPRFRVIVAGIPTPRYAGNPLDPPLRSRFQYRTLAPLSAVAQLAELRGKFPNADANTLRGLVSFALSISATPTAPSLPYDATDYVAFLLERHPQAVVAKLLQQAFPFRFMALEEPVVAAVEAGLKWLHWSDENGPVELVAIENGIAVGSDGVRISVGGSVITESLPAEAPLFAMAIDVMEWKKPVLLIGERGSGKTFLLRNLSSLLDHKVVVMQLYEDLAARDLLQRRSTDDRGDTIWHDSELILAARRGYCCVLDGLDQLRPGVLASVQRLLQEGEIELPDGSRLVSAVRFSILQKKCSSERLLHIAPVHPDFRVLATGQSATKKKPWLNALVLSMFKVHVLEGSTSPQRIQRLLLGAGANPACISVLQRLNASLAALGDATLPPLSLRQLLRLAHTSADRLREGVLSCFLAPFLPLAAKTQLEAICSEVGLLVPLKQARWLEIVQHGSDRVNIGRVSGVVRQDSNSALVPKVSFFPVQAHLVLLEAILEDWNAGEHLLLIGNQGVGKNVLTDKLLELLGQEREYVQVHRDTTVLSLSLSPSLVGGVVVWEDSPLVRAAQYGRVLVLDEADKAPLEVVVLLRSLLQDGDMMLGDGRRCVRPHILNSAPKESDRGVLVMHPNFRVIALANRPGFPFLGNNFFARVGDCFAAHVVGNVDEQSELHMLRSYGPSVPQFLLERLVKLFGELRAMVDAGTLQHPYSLRELVQIVKHLDRFPDNLAGVLHNVFSLDLSNSAVAPLLTEVLRRHGVPVDVVGAARVLRASWQSFADREKTLWRWTERPSIELSTVDTGSLVRHRPWKWRPEHMSRVKGRSQGRINKFSELAFSFNLPPRSIVADCVCSGSGHVHVLLSSPVQVLTFSPDFSEFGTIDLAAHLPYHRSSLPARPSMLTLTAANVLVVFLPVYRMLIVVDEPGCYATPVQIPALDTSASGDTSVFNEQMFPDTAALRGGAKPTLVAVGDLTVVAWSFGGRVLCFLDVVSLLWSHKRISVPFEIDRVVSSKLREWLVQPIQSADVYLLSQDNLSLIRRFSCSPSLSVVAARDHLLNSDRDLLLTQCESGWMRYPLKDEGDRVVQAQVLEGAPRAMVVQTDKTLLLVDTEQEMVRNLCGEEAQMGSVASWCELNNGSGQVFVVRSSGEVSVYDCNSDRLASEEKMWRVVVGLPDQSDEQQQQQLEEVDAQLSLALDNVVVAGKGSEGKRGAGGGGAGIGAGAGGVGQGSGGEGEGSGGTSGVKRSGDGGPRDPRGLEDREVDELQRAMARKGLEEELALIAMGKADLTEYREIVASVAGEIEQLRNVLLALEARGKERAWLKGKTTGDFDDTRLVENIVGDANVFKRRGQQAPRAYAPQEKAKRLMLCVDVSASMYRFNTQDQRLARLQALVVMVMEALDGEELSRKYHYSIVGHSGDDSAIPLGAEFGCPPKTAKERFALIKRMVAHSEYCSSGDSSLEALREGVKKVAEEEADDYFLLLVSDANLSRYGVDPSEFGAELSRNPEVNAFALFIASFDNEAESMKSKMPLGKAHVTFDTAQIPSVFRQIFASTSFMRDQ